MIKTFFINIIIAVIHLVIAENNLKLYHTDLNSRVGYTQISATSLLYKSIDINKSGLVNFLHGASSSPALLEKKANIERPELNADWFKILSNNHRKRFEIFETDVSPPVRLFV